MAIIDNGMLWRQFGGAIDMLAEAIRECPDDLWERRLWDDRPDQWVMPGFSTVWYLCYHTLFWLDLYLTGTEDGFTPPAPFALVEMRSGESLPRTYSRDELLGYLDHCRRRCQETIDTLTPEQAERVCSFSWGRLPFGELLLYNFRHVQHHAAQIRMAIGQHTGKSLSWINLTGNPVGSR